MGIDPKVSCRERKVCLCSLHITGETFGRFPFGVNLKKRKKAGGGSEENLSVGEKNKGGRGW